MFEDTQFKMSLITVLAAIVGILLLILGPLLWTVHRILRPVDQAARERNLPFRFSMGDTLCLFWIVQIPLGFVYRLAPERSRNGSNEDVLTLYYWILIAGVWIVAPLAWVTVARALSKAGVSMGKHRLIFLGIVLPTVYYGLFPFMGMSAGVLMGIAENGAGFFLERKELTSCWVVLGLSLIACGFYSPWMVRRAAIETDDMELAAH
jgi:hypothetical protein